MPRTTYRLVTTTPELLSQINPENLKLKLQFLKEKNMRSSDGTIKNYDSDLNIFFVYNLQYNNNKFFIDIKKLEFSEFFAFCTTELKWGSARFGRMKACLSSFSNFIEKFFDSEYKDFRNVILRAVESMPKSERREKTIMSEKQVNDLLSYLSETIKDDQGACWFALSIASGARFAEILRFTTDIIDENNTVFDGLFLETTKQIKTKGRTKEGKMQKKYIIKDLFLPYYKKWLVEREKIMVANNKNHNFIFIKPNGDPAEEGTIRSWLPKLEKFLNVPFYSHCARHFFVTYLSKAGLSAELIVELTGWTSSDMYKIYNDLGVKDREWKELVNLKEYLNK